MYELLFRRTLIFGVPAVPFVPFRVQLLVQSSVLYLPLHRRFYCDRLDRFLPVSSSLFSLSRIVDSVVAEK